MNIGKLNKRITLLKPDTVPDGRGGWKANPNNPSGALKAAEVWADAQIPKIRTVVIKDAIANEVIQEFWIRYYPDIKLGWRVEYEGRTYKVLHAYDEQRIKTIITCREVVR